MSDLPEHLDRIAGAIEGEAARAESPIASALLMSRAAHIRRASEALRAPAPAPSPWQGIETAPQGSVIDLWSSQGFRYVDAIWDVAEYRAVDDPRPEVYGWTDANHHGSIEEAGPFTHWMIPARPPADGGEG